MIQESFTLHWETDRPAFIAKVKEVLWEKRAESDARADSAVYIHLLFRLLCKVTATQVRAAIAEVFPQAVVTGMSEGLYGSDKNDSVLQMNMTFLEKSRIEQIEYTGSPTGYAKAGLELSAQIQAMADVKAVAIYCAGLSVDFYQFINCLTRDNPDIPFFGATAGMFEFSADRHKLSHLFSFNEMNDVEQQYVIGQDMYRQGIVLAVFCGKDLQVKADYLFGWKGLGKEMTISATRGNNCISRIDNIRPTEIYHRYLNVIPDENFVYNISEFPLAIERNGCVIARVPPRYDEEGRLYFSSDVYTGEKIRLTYAVHEDLLKETAVSSEYMWGFAPEALFLTICGNRILFLKEKAAREVESYSRFAPHLICNYGTSELYCHHGQGGILNSALIAVGMREGEAHLKLSDIDLSQRDEHRIIPLSERMATFLNAVTQELAERNRELQDMAHAAEAASLAKSQFLSNMSHEIRTPINAVLGMDEMILRETQEAPTREYAENIRTAGNTLLGLINDILDFSKIEAGKMEIIPVEYAVSSLLNDLANMTRQRAKKKGLTLYVEAAEDMPSVLKGDEIRLRQVSTNILTNAIKYTEEGSVTLRLCWSPDETDANAIHLRVEVQDTGIGIKEEDIGKLFRAFERIEEERNRTIEGTGLGMNITQRLLELMGSELEVTSTYGEGSCFAFTVTQQVLNHAPMGDYEAAYRQHVQQQQPYQESFVAPDARILIVDDTAMNLTVAKGLLKQTQMHLDTALSGYECLEKMQATPYDLVLLDHRMPGMDGIETLQKIKELAQENAFPNRSTPVIALTANAISGAREEYMAAGFDDYLTKPIDSRQLEKMLQKYLPAAKVHPADTANGQPQPEQDAELPVWLQDVQGLDLAAGVQHCGSTADYLDALTVFAQSIDSGATEIQRFYDLQDWTNYTTKVHALKSTARVVGASELSEKARRLEDAGNNGYCDEIRANTAPLLELYRSYAGSLAPLLPQEKADSEKAPISASELAEAWEALHEIAVSFDYDSLTYMLDELSNYQLTGTDAERLAAAKKAAALPDWDALQKL